MPPADRGGPGTVTPHQVNELVRAALSRELPSTLHVLGEIGDISRPASGHLYFSLKDVQSELRCVMWRSSAERLKFRPEGGMEVIATGTLDVYTPRGTYQLMVRKLEPRGAGALEIAFRQLKARLEREGLFDPRRKKPLPPIPRRLALVTSPSGAAPSATSCKRFARRFPALDILLLPVRVQGEGAAAEIAAAIGLMNEHAGRLGGIDVAIVGRGGGSLEDLWAFNEDIVARAIAASRIPIVSAVGHEVDVTISDLVADLRAPTPTAAAELVAPRLDDLLESISQNAGRATRAAKHALELSAARLKAVLAYDGLARPLARLRERGQLVDELQQRLRLTTIQRFRDARERLNRADLATMRFRSGAHFRRLAERVNLSVHRLHRALGQPVLRGERALTTRLSRLERVAPPRQLGRLDEHVQQTLRRLGLVVAATLTQRRRELRGRLETLAAYDPQRVLERGYSITRDARTRRIIRSVRQVRDRMRTITQLADGEFRATADDPRQPSLFDEPGEPDSQPGCA